MKRNLAIIATAALALSSATPASAAPAPDLAALAAAVQSKEWIAQTNVLETFISSIDGSIYGADLDRGKAVAFGNVILTNGMAQGVMIIPLEDYISLTNELEYVRYRYYDDEPYRVFRHGKQKKKELNIQARAMLQIYADGAVYTNQLTKAEHNQAIATNTNKLYTTRSKPTQVKTLSKRKSDGRPAGMSTMRWKLQQEIEARRKEPIINRTMNYDPVTKKYKEVK